MPRRLLSAAAAGALLLSLAACGDAGQETVTTPPPSIDIDAPSDGGGDPEPSDGGDETDEPTAATPDIPPPDPAEYAGMDEQTPEGAEQAFRYYIAVSIWAHQTGDVEILSTLHSSTCTGCSEFNGDIPDLRDDNLLWSAAEISNPEVSLETSSNHEHEVRYKFTLGSHSRPNNENTERVELESLDFDSAGGLNWQSDRWITDGLSIEWGSDVR